MSSRNKTSDGFAADMKTKRNLAYRLIRHYLDSEWVFVFDRAVRRAGLCNYTKKQISVSKHFAVKASLQEFEQVVLHEIAHALAGHKEGHGELWKEISRLIGYKGARLTQAAMAVTAPWQGNCPAGHKHERFKKPARALSCGACSKSFSKSHLIEWEYLPAYSR